MFVSAFFSKSFSKRDKRNAQRKIHMKPVDGQIILKTFWELFIDERFFASDSVLAMHVNTRHQDDQRL